MRLQGRDRTRELVRQRDRYACQQCHRVWIEGERRFDVHHLKGVCGKKSTGYDRLEDMDKLITYCHKCHLGLESNRKKMSIAGIGKKHNYPKGVKRPRKNIL